MHPSTPSYSPEAFAIWWAERRRLWGEDAGHKDHSVREIFNLLACALGPLRREDLPTLVGESEDVRWAIDEVLVSGSPFITGRGEPPQYGIGDPGLKRYLFEHLTEGERSSWEKRFLDWGRRTLAQLAAGTLRPNGAAPYVIRFYGAHLERAGGRETDLFALVRDEWRRAWNGLEGCDTGFLVDVDRAWRASVEIDRAVTATDQIAPHLGTEIRCALCRSTAASLATRLPPALLGALVEGGIWTPEQALAQALNAPGDERTLAALRPFLSSELLHQALNAALAIEDWQVHARGLIALAPALTETMVQEALPAVVRNLEKWASWGELGRLAPHLSPESVREVLAATLELGDWKARVDAMVALAPYLSRGQLREATSAARKLEDAGARAFVLAKMIPHVPQDERADLVAETLRAVDTSDGGQYYVNALILVMRDLSQVERDRWLPRLLGAVAQLEEETFRILALEGLAPYLTEPVHKEALEVIGGIGADWARAYALGNLAPYLRGPLLGDAFRIARAIEDRSQRAAALSSLAPYMSDSLLEEGLNEALAIDRNWSAAEAVANIVPHLPERLARAALSAAQELEDNGLREKTLAAVGLRFAHLGHQQEADELLTKIEGSWAWVDLIHEIAPRLPDSQLRDMATAAEAIEDVRRRAEALIRLAPHVPHTEQVRFAESILTALGPGVGPSERSLVLPALVPYLKGDSLGRAVELAQELDDAVEQIETLIQVAVQLAELGHVQDALSAVAQIRDPDRRVAGLAELVPHLKEPERGRSLAVALDSARRIETRSTRAHLLATLATSLPPTQRNDVVSEALESASGIEKEQERARVILMVAQILENESAGAQTEDEAVHRSQGGTLIEALGLAKTSPSSSTRREGLASLSPDLSRLARSQLMGLWQELLPVLAARPREELLPDLGALMPVISVLGGRTALMDTAQAVLDVGRWWP